MSHCRGSILHPLLDFNVESALVLDTIRSNSDLPRPSFTLPDWDLHLNILFELIRPSLELNLSVLVIRNDHVFWSKQ